MSWPSWVLIFALMEWGEHKLLCHKSIHEVWFSKVFILNKITNATLLFLLPFLMSWRQRSKTFSIYTKDPFFSNIVHKSVLICVSERPPHRCGISRCWLDGMIIAQVWLRLATIEGHSEMCSFALLGGGGQKTSQCLVWPPFASHLLRIDLIRLLTVVWGMLVHSSSMAVQSCWILAGTGTCCRIPIVYV